ncbi:type II toxin-antitoxin system VapC family toxin [Microbacterium sp. PMB16]|uniref:type II toxin-antitoxin system VapC family toxin n=1 Tax=Microbacterium sp. PMB16 TaxID=3120157 RepID=UPI003F4B263D
MIIDTSALIAIVKDEPEAEAFEELLANVGGVISAGTLAEALIVGGGFAGPDGMAEIETMLRNAGTTVVSVDETQARLVGRAYLRYGRGSGHPARLNYGDCFSYALAITRDEPLLFKGDDFIHTDVRRVPSGR